MIRRDFER
jgi:hypothetical protein